MANAIKPNDDKTQKILARQGSVRRSKFWNQENLINGGSSKKENNGDETVARNLQKPPMAPRSVGNHLTNTNFANDDVTANMKKLCVSNSKAQNGHFRANPVNWAMLASPTVGVYKQKPASPTKPKEFKFRTAVRALVKRTPSAEAELDLEECFTFKAQPMPIGSPDALPPKKLRPATVPQPFCFETDKIVEEHMEKLQKKLKEEEEERRQAAEFRAKAMPDFQSCFLPKLRDKKFTEPENILLATDKRAGERKRLEEKKKAAEAVWAEQKPKWEAEEQRREKAEIRKLRKEKEFKAQPIKHYKAVEIKHDPTKITIPHSPKFNIERRLLERPSSRNGVMH